MLLKSLKPIFENIGLTEVALKIYLHLLKHPGQTVNQLAEAGGITRTNCYNYINNLENKGLIYLIPEVKVNRYNATEPSQIGKLLKDQVNTTSDQLTLLSSLESQFQTLQTEVPLPEVRFFKGQEAIEILLKEAFQHTKIDLIYNSKPDNPIFPKLRNKLLKWIETHPETQLREIRNHEYINSKKILNSPNFSLRFAKSEQLLHSRIILVPNKIYLIKRLDISEEQSQIIGICIEDNQMYNTHQTLFDLLWDNSTEQNKS